MFLIFFLSIFLLYFFFCICFFLLKHIFFCICFFKDAAHDYINWEAAAANQDVAGAAPRKGLVRVAPTAGDRM